MARGSRTERKRNSGMFQPGQSGNPSGRPKQTRQERDFIELCKANADAAMAAVMAVLADSNARPLDRLKAAEFIADRAYGKPVGRDVIASLNPQTADRMSDAELLAAIEAGRSENVLEFKDLRADQDEEAPPDAI
jgi:hypothetical protein